MKHWLNVRSWFVFVLVLQTCSFCLGDEKTFAGRWQSTFGPMRLVQVGDRVTGTYTMQNVECSIEGHIKEGRLTFNYREGDTVGEGWFRLAADGKSFAGRWREKGIVEWSPWVARRIVTAVGTARNDASKGFAGLWSSTYGRMRLVQSGDEIHGIYGNGSTLSGKIQEGRLVFRYVEPEAIGEGWFELADDGEAINGKWKQDDTSEWNEWRATRVYADPRIRWLVVIEARWEANLTEREYAFGDMLKAFFNRDPSVQVRRRFFNDENDLRRWCREAALLAEPVVLCIATHGTTEGIQVAGRTIEPDAIADSLRFASNVQLLHFSACLMMKDQLAGRIMKKLGDLGDFPISGYATSVDWAASALIEFLYFDLILVRKMPPKKAADQVKLMFPIAREKDVKDAVLPAAGFRLLLPKQPSASTSAKDKPTETE